MLQEKRSLGFGKKGLGGISVSIIPGKKVIPGGQEEKGLTLPHEGFRLDSGRSCRGPTHSIATAFV